MRTLAVVGLLGSVLLHPTASAAQAQAAPVQTVRRLYRAFAWEAIFSSPADHTPGFIDQPLAVLKNYLTDDLARLLVADRECTARSGEICHLDFQPLWASQDPLVSDLTIAATRDSTFVAVEYRTGDGTRTVHISYRLVPTQGGWRIADIEYPGRASLKALLTGR